MCGAVLLVPVYHAIRVMGAPDVKRRSQDPGGWSESAFPFQAAQCMVCFWWISLFGLFLVCSWFVIVSWCIWNCCG